jgi:hypothetical protein
LVVKTVLKENAPKVQPIQESSFVSGGHNARESSQPDVPGESKFDGGLLSYIGWSILGAIVTLFTLGICYPWALCMVYGWRINHTIINGKRLRFKGTAVSLLGHWVLWLFLCVITLGIYSFWLFIALEKWKVKNTSFAEDAGGVSKGGEADLSQPAASPAAAGAGIAEREAREPREAEKTEKRGEKAKPKEKKTGHIISLIIMLIIIVGLNVIYLYEEGKLLYSDIVAYGGIYEIIGMVFILAHLIAAINSIALCKRPKKEQTRVIALMSMFILIAGFDISRIACEFFPALINSVFYGYQYGYQLDARDFAPLFIITLPIVVTAVIALCKRPKKEPARIIALVILVLTAGVHIFFIAGFVLWGNFYGLEDFLPDVLVIITHFVAVINIIALCKRLKKNGV